MENDIYWANRLADRIYKHNTNRTYKKLKRLYTRQAQNIKLAIIQLYADMLEDGEISTTNLYKYGRYNALLDEFDKYIGNFAKDEIKEITDCLEQAYIEAFEKTSNTMGNDVQWTLQNKYMMEEAINANFKGKYFSDRVWDSKRKMINLLGREIQDIVASGKNKDEAVKAIMNSTGTVFSNADRLIRTETMRVINDGQKNSYINNGYTEYKILVSEDERLCDECGNKDGKVIGFSEAETGVNFPPFHPNCRCTIIPIVK